MAGYMVATEQITDRLVKQCLAERVWDKYCLTYTLELRSEATDDFPIEEQLEMGITNKVEVR
jgi:hypothetical protein